jgi:predicted LPLAT superfamily acyltransferase
LEARQEGFVQLSAHIGNYEIAGYTLVSQKKRFNALVYAGEKASVMRNRDKMFADTNINMIAVSPDMSHLFEIDKALAEGEIVSMPADRISGSPKYIEHDFLDALAPKRAFDAQSLGAKAKFPFGPFSVVTMRSLDVLAVNVMKTSLKGYKIYVTPLCYDKTAPRQEQIRQLCGAYVAELEKRVRQYPTQWYNYYEFWNA